MGTVGFGHCVTREGTEQMRCGVGLSRLVSANFNTFLDAVEDSSKFS